MNKMKKRPLCVMCLVFLIAQAVFLVITSGDGVIDIPTSSIFSEMEDGQKRQVTIQGRIYRKEYTSNNQVLYLKNNSISDQNHSYEESRIMIYDKDFCDYCIGETLLVSGAVQKFEKGRNPGNFDRQLYYARQNIYGCVFDANILASDGEESWIKERLWRLRKSWKEMLYEHMSQEQGPVLAAMILNEKTDMEESTKDLYQKNGISHVLAISGLHISFIGLGFYQLLRKLRFGYGSAGMISVLILSSYVLMIGFSVSIFRAYVMLLFRVTADMTGRVYDMATALLFSAALTVAYQPLYLTDAAFCLSYGAILAILLTLPQMQGCLAKHCKKHKFFKGIVEGAMSCAGIQFFLLPVILFFYYEIPLTSFVLNIVVIPLMSWVLALGIYGSIFHIIWKPLGQILLTVCDWMLSSIAWMGELGLEFPFLRVVCGKPDIWNMAVYYLLLFIVLYLSKKKSRQRKWCVPVMLVMMLFLLLPIPDGTLHITMMDVGQGDCIFVRGPRGKCYLIDGGSSDVKEVGKYRIESFLKSQGVGTLDYVFVSHGDADHTNGIESLLMRRNVGVRIRTLVLPGNYRHSEELLDLARVAAKQKVQVVSMDPEDTLSEVELQISCLQPHALAEDLTDNAGSMVLHLQYKTFDMLFTGDVEGIGEERLMEHPRLADCDVLKVSHHGSKNSTMEAFLEVVRPEIALISVGAENSYGHPHEETIMRLKDVGSQIYRTDIYGAIMLETDGEFIDIFPSCI